LCFRHGTVLLQGGPFWLKLYLPKGHMNLELHDLQTLTRQLRERVLMFLDRYSNDSVSWD
jgi:hypothetical protein